MIQLSHLSVGFRDHAVLSDISTTIAPGSTTAIMGPNGCGKTTLLRCIGGMLAPNAGSVSIDGREVMSYPARQLAQRVAYVQQRAHTDFDFTAWEIVLMGRNPYIGHLGSESSTDFAIAQHCMQQTGTWHLRHSRPASMSGGELQRVMIARALAQQTPILLLDEPVSNLDIAHQIEVMRLLSARSQHHTTLVVLHDLNLALRYCDRLILLHRGNLLFHGATKEGLTHDNIRLVYGVEAQVSDGRVAIDY